MNPKKLNSSAIAMSVPVQGFLQKPISNVIAHDDFQTPRHRRRLFWDRADPHSSAVAVNIARESGESRSSPWTSHR